eukprot:12921521-Prorocentrum_lima.AAC.1
MAGHGSGNIEFSTHDALARFLTHLFVSQGTLFRVLTPPHIKLSASQKINASQLDNPIMLPDVELPGSTMQTRKNL